MSWMPRKPTPKPDNPEQFKRFIDMAREVEVDESAEALERAFKRVVPHSPQSTSGSLGRTIPSSRIRRQRNQSGRTVGRQ